MFRHLANACVCTLIVISSQHAIATENPDPWENVNRKIFAFNKNADTYVLKPIARGYRAATPDIVDNSITRFFDNLQQPLVIINNGLQGKGQQAASDTGRFLVNTITSLGFADVASHMGLVKHEEDFGQTFGKWGASSGAYVMLPFLGPSSVRDALAKPLDMLVNHDAPLNMALAGLQVVDTRADLIPIEKIIEGDEYLFLRDIYLQRREFLVQDGKVKDSFMDDMDDESNEAAQ